MEKPAELTKVFEAHRSHLRAVAYRMLGSLAEADDAVQKAWLKLADISGRQNTIGAFVHRSCDKASDGVRIKAAQK
jgi:DNA-directed RNA polymerase specialized sigma24 family protein